MNVFNSIKFACCLFLVCSFFSCSDEPMELYTNEDLYGYYKRSDSAEVVQYELHLNRSKNSTGYFIHYYGTWCGYDEYEGSDVCFSAALAEVFFWRVKNNILTIDINDEVILIDFSIDQEGNLYFSEPNYLTDYKDLNFIKLSNY